MCEEFRYHELNRSLSLSAVEGVTETTIGRPIELELVNEGDHIIVSSPRERRESGVDGRKTRRLRPDTPSLKAITMHRAH